MTQPAERTDYPAKIAGLLEDLASRVRALTVDRVAVAVTWIAIGLVIFAALVTALIWIVIGLFRALGTLIGVELAYLLVGGILVIIGALLWWRRYPKEDRAAQE